MEPHAITGPIVRTALKALRGGRLLRDCPLVHLDLVTLRLRDDGMRDAPESRAWAVGGVLDEVVRAELARRRQVAGIAAAEPATGRSAAIPPAAAGPSTAGPAAPADPGAAAAIAAAFAAGDADLEAWSVLWARYLAPRAVPVARLAHDLGVVRRTLERRTERGAESLAAELRRREIAATRTLARLPGRPAAERVIVVEPAAGEGGVLPGADAGPALEPLRRALLGAVRADDAVIRLTAREARAVARADARDLEAYRLARIAEWSQPRYRLDQRFVALSLLVDQGESTAGGRWQVATRRFDRLADVLDAVAEPAVVVLGPPGAGKSTLLRRFELDLACGALRGAHDHVTCFVPLNHYRAPLGGDPPAPLDWLSARWQAQHPELPALAHLLGEGRLTLLLDALNEMPHADPADYHRRVLAWKQLLHDVVLARPGNRVIFSCRSLDYSAPLSTPTLRVPQVRIEPLTDAQARRFLELYAPARAARIWREIAATAQLDLLRSPYFLTLLVAYVESEDRIPIGRAGLFTGFTRQALRREIERDNPLFAPGGLLTARDCRQVALAGPPADAYALPTQGPLFPGLARLAFEMQRQAEAGRTAQVRVDHDEAVALLDRPDTAEGERILAAGLALGVLDEPGGAASLTFFHQLLQEYFAARRLAAAPEPGLVAAEWRAAGLVPGLPDLLAALPPAEPLPPLPATGWEETALLAAPMAAGPDVFVLGVAAGNLPLAGRCAVQPELRDVLAPPTVDGLRRSLVERSRDADADLRARIDAARALGRLGDPRFERRVGPDGDVCLVPPLVEIRGGVYPVGTGTGGVEGAARLEPFAIGRFPVTNAEWACFVRAGGYDDPRWWTGAAAGAWQRGEGTAEGSREGFRDWRRRLRADPAILDDKRREGLLPPRQYDDWVARLRMSDAEFEAHLAVYWPAGRKAAPEYWQAADFNHPAQPVVGVSWFEARAYCRWLAAQTGSPFRLPTEAEWEAAARGTAGRRYAYGDTADPLACNAAETRLQRPSPGGVFVAGDTPEGVSDLTGNVSEWLAGGRGGDPANGDRDPDPAADATVLAALRGGSFAEAAAAQACATRRTKLAAVRVKDLGFRVAQAR